MPAPSPIITARKAAKVGRPSGPEAMTSTICPAATPSSAPMSVAVIAAPERNSSVSRRIAKPMPTSSPTGASCSAARSGSIPRASTCTVGSAVSPAAISASPSSFLMSPGSVE